LTLFKTGEDTKAEWVAQHGTWSLESGCSIGFMEPLWGGTTCHLVEAMQKLIKEHWQEVMEECKPYLSCHAPGDVQPNEGDPNGGHQSSGLYASIQVDW